MLALLTDEILRDRMPDLAPADWRKRLRNIAAAVQSAYRDYPGSAAFVLSRSANRLAQPNALLIRDTIFAALAQAGLREPQQQEMLILFSVITLGNIVVAEIPACGRALNGDGADTGRGRIVARDRYTDPDDREHRRRDLTSIDLGEALHAAHGVGRSVPSEMRAVHPPERLFHGERYLHQLDIAAVGVARIEQKEALATGHSAAEGDVVTLAR